LQVEIHPFLTQTKLVRYARENGVSVTAYSSFGGGSYVEMGRAKEADSCLTDPKINEMATRYGKTAGQVALRWGIQHGCAVIPKSMNNERMASNLDLFSFTLSAEDMETINNMNLNRRFNDPGHWCEIANNTFWPVFE